MYRNFMVPMPKFDSFADLNAYLESCCRKRQLDVVLGHIETIAAINANSSLKLLLTLMAVSCIVFATKQENEKIVCSFSNDKHWQREN